MSKVLEIQQFMNGDNIAKVIHGYYDNWSSQRNKWVEEKKELRNYIFATDTTKTTNNKLPWKNSTTIPTICSIRDRLHASYMTALGEDSRKWFDWDAKDEESDYKEKKEAIKAYIAAKWEESHGWEIVSKLVYDYIDYGIVYAAVDAEFKYVSNEVTGNLEPVYIGPQLKRTDPLAHVINPTSESYEKTPKITRYVKSLGELIDDYDFKNDVLKYDGEVIAHLQGVRRGLQHYNKNDVDKAVGYTIDGFGSYHSYITSGYVELLEFEGDLYDVMTGELRRNRLITIVDRQWVLRDIPNPSWLPGGSRCSVNWRERTDNLLGMGPLDNLVGMQYRQDHLENLKADAMDLMVLPVQKVKGDVEEYDYQPGEKIFIGIEGDVESFRHELGPVVQASNDIVFLIDKMEESAGAPKMKSGFRTPGEKTATEMQILQNNSDVMFKSKTMKFSNGILEPILNMYLELGVRYMKGTEMVKTLDEDGIEYFLKITKEDITGAGKLTPIAARHYSEKAQLMNNINIALQTSAVVPSVMNHVSAKKLAYLIFEEGINYTGVVGDNIGLVEQAETQRLANSMQDQVAQESITPTEEVDETIE